MRPCSHRFTVSATGCKEVKHKTHRGGSGPIVAAALFCRVSAGNLVGTLLYFLWFDMGLIALIFPVSAIPLVLRLDWPYLVGVTWLATLLFARGRLGHLEGVLLVALYCVYVVLHVVLG
jgi:Ca2+/Na+ antiporter